MRITFLRGVSALNQEAMGMFKNQMNRSDSYVNLSRPLPTPMHVPRSHHVSPVRESPLSAASLSAVQWEETKKNVISSTRGLVTRHYKK